MQTEPNTKNLVEFEAAIAKIRISFLQTLRDHRASLVQLLQIVLQEGSAEAEFEKIGGIAHKIAGVAGTLQLPELGAIAIRTERLIDSALGEEGSFTVSTELLESTATLLEHVNQVCNEDIAP